MYCIAGETNGGALGDLPKFECLLERGSVEDLIDGFLQGFGWSSSQLRTLEPAK